jgi:hypothetical protein
MQNWEGKFLQRGTEVYFENTLLGELQVRLGP